MRFWINIWESRSTFRAHFVFAYNSSDCLQETLRSRIHEIAIEPYTIEDKMSISKQFFIPQSCAKLNLSTNKIKFNDAVIRSIITNYTLHEQGVRDLERKIDEIILKIHWLSITSETTSLRTYICPNINVIAPSVSPTPSSNQPQT